ncbi:MAG: hypothetical protein A3D92_20525 [Bacteroidetes bacterium RIFCSPHIGHO2_02_FULL_44_7]|nr:MAG: hypothetical protein A3D92_20525 [Bacteroidetes bacterium RIFCSPHIGHO2_02_FULL_44_7]
MNTEYPLWTHRDTIVKTYGAMPLQFSDDATTAGNWTGNWTTTGATYVSPSKSYTDGVGNYANDANKTTELVQSIDLTNATQAMVSFYAKWEIEAGYDYCQFQVSTNGGSTWIGQCGNYTVQANDQGGVQPDGKPVYEGAQSSWVLEEINLSDYLGETINVRFQLESDGGVRMDGFYFDDFQVFYSIDDAGIAENTLELKTFPNPANQQVTVSVSNPISSGDLEVFDQTGKLVYSKKVEEPTSNITFSTQYLPQGMYTVRVSNQGLASLPVKLAIVH